MNRFVFILIGLVALAYCTEDVANIEVDDNDEPDIDLDLDEEIPTTTASSVVRGWRRGGFKGRKFHPAGRNAFKNMTSEERVNRFCSRVSRVSSVERVDRRPGRMERKMDRLTQEQSQILRDAWQRKKTELRACCALEGEKRIPCAEKVKTDRIDRVCAKEEPLCAFSLIRAEGEYKLPEKIETCCVMEGSGRYDCFMEAKLAWMQNKHQRKRMLRKKKF